MEYAYNEALSRIGRIDEDGTVYDTSGNSMAKIHDSGYIFKLSGDGSASIFGRIDKDGTIRNPGGDVVGRIEANGYIYIQSRVVGRFAYSRNNQSPKDGNETASSPVSGHEPEKESSSSGEGQSDSFSPGTVRIYGSGVFGLNETTRYCLLGLVAGCAITVINIIIHSMLWFDWSDFSLPNIFYEMAHPVYSANAFSHSRYTTTVWGGIYRLLVIFLPPIVGAVRGYLYSGDDWWRIALFPLITAPINVLLFILLIIIHLFVSGEIFFALLFIALFSGLCGGVYYILVIIL